MGNIQVSPAGSIWDELASNHVVAGSFGSGASRPATKTITFTGGVGAGAVGTVALFTTTGLVAIEEIYGRVTTNLTGATATIALGVTGQTAIFIAATTATTLTTAAELWVSTTATTGGIVIPAADKQVLIDANIFITVAVAAVATGVLEIDVLWHPVSTGATLV